VFPPRPSVVRPAATEGRSLGAGKRRGSPANRRSEMRGSLSGPAESALAGLIGEVERLRSQVEQVTATAAFQQRTH
jgi:hypothetical protein